MRQGLGGHVKKGEHSSPVTFWHMDPFAAKGLLRHSSVNTTLQHRIKDVPTVTQNATAQLEELLSELDLAGQAVP